MKEEKKIPLEEIMALFREKKGYQDPDAAFKTLYDCWIIHPKFKSPTRQTSARRLREDGFAWLKEAELASFESYIGEPLR